MWLSLTSSHAIRMRLALRLSCLGLFPALLAVASNPTTPTTPTNPTNPADTEDTVDCLRVAWRREEERHRGLVQEHRNLDVQLQLSGERRAMLVRLREELVAMNGMAATVVEMQRPTGEEQTHATAIVRAVESLREDLEAVRARRRCVEDAMLRSWNGWILRPLLPFLHARSLFTPRRKSRPSGALGTSIQCKHAAMLREKRAFDRAQRQRMTRLTAAIDALLRRQMDAMLEMNRAGGRQHLLRHEAIASLHPVYQGLFRRSNAEGYQQFCDVLAEIQMRHVAELQAERAANVLAVLQRLADSGERHWSRHLGSLAAVNVSKRTAHIRDIWQLLSAFRRDSQSVGTSADSIHPEQSEQSVQLVQSGQSGGLQEWQAYADAVNDLERMEGEVAAHEPVLADKERYRSSHLLVNLFPHYVIAFKALQRLGMLTSGQSVDGSVFVDDSQVSAEK